MKKVSITPADIAEVSVLSRTAAEQLVERLKMVKRIPEKIADIGCGAGDCSKLLAELYPHAKILATDNHLSMLQYAKQQAKYDAYFVCAQEKTLPIKTSQIELVASNFLIPWCMDLKKLFTEWSRILHPEGLLIFTALGIDTLSEFHAEDKKFILPALYDMHEIGDLLTKLHFSDPVMDVEYFSLTYRDKEKLLHELKLTDMIDKNIHQIDLTPNQDGIYSLTFEVIYGHAWAPPIKQGFSADSEGKVKIPLDHLRGRL